MKRSSLFGHIIELHAAVSSSRHPVDAVVREFFRARHYLGSKDRRFIAEALYGLLRNFRLLYAYCAAATKLYPLQESDPQGTALTLLAADAIHLRSLQPEVLQPDIVGIWPIHFPVNDCGEFLRVLKGVELQQLLPEEQVRRTALVHSFPDAVVAEWVNRMGVAEAERLCEVLNRPAPTTIRVNTLRTSVAECARSLASEGVETMPTALSPVGLVVTKRMNAQSLRSFRNGYFEMQDEGSQILSLLVEAKPGETIVDACAGAGGKTLHLGAEMDDQGVLIAMDVEDRRLQVLRERVARAGLSCVRTIGVKSNPNELLQLHGSADAVIIDAPCTGMGTVRRNPGLKITFTEGILERMNRLQREVLETYSGLVRPGGRLVYATCSLLEQENEAIVDWFLSVHAEFKLRPVEEILASKHLNIESPEPWLRLLPHHTSTDGFFAAVMTRSA